MGLPEQAEMKENPIRGHAGQPLTQLLTRLRFGIFLLCAVGLFGVIGFRIVEQCSWIEALFHTVCVLTTLGAPPELDNYLTMEFTILQALSGIGLFLYVLTVTAQYLIAGELHRSLGRRKILIRMKQLY